MATWPSATKASTANLDSGTDSPASARADLKTNVDNVNSVIDMFNIASPTNNQILKYNTSNSRFELASDTDTNTTYGISAETSTGGVNLRLTGSDASTDDVKLAEGSNITLTRTDANTITIAGSAGGIATVSADTTPSLGGNLTVNGNSIISASNGNIAITPNGTGSIVLDGLSWPQADGSADQVLKTNGSGQLSFATAGGGGAKPTAYIKSANGYINMPSTSGGQMTSNWTLIDAGGIAGLSVSTNTFILPAGTYIVYFPMLNSFGTHTKVDVGFRNVTDGTTVQEIQTANFTLGGRTESFYGSPFINFTIAASKTFTLTNLANPGSAWELRSGVWPNLILLTIVKIS